MRASDSQPGSSNPVHAGRDDEDDQAHFAGQASLFNSFAVNPKADEVEGVETYPDLASLPEAVHGISVITQPSVTEEIVEQAGKLGIKNIWMQPGSESKASLRRAEELGVNIIAGGPCNLVILGFRD